jgi:hypothetical protein
MRSPQVALGALEALEATGTSITFIAVAQAAGLSTWLGYSEGIHTHIDVQQEPPSPRASGKTRFRKAL